MTNDEKKIDVFENYKLSKAFITLVIPTVISQIITIIYNYADTWFVGRCQKEEYVAAISIALPIFILISALANLFGIGSSAQISRLLGMGKKSDAKKVFVNAIYLSIFVALLYSILLLIFYNKVSYIIGSNEDTSLYVWQYSLIVVIIGSVPIMLSNVFGQLVRSTGKPIIASIGLGIGGLINIILDPLFMFVLLPKGNEIIGVGLATIISNIISCLFFIIYIKKNNNDIYSINILDFNLKNAYLKDVLLIGIPASLTIILAMVSNITANFLMRDYGTFAQAGLGLAKRANTLSFNICMGITQGMLPFIAYNYASKNHQRMKKGILLMYSVTVIFGFINLILYQLFTKSFISFFIKNQPDALHSGVTCLKLISIAVPLCAISFSSMTVFQATSRKVFSFILSILRKGVLDIPLMYLFSRKFLMKGILYATPVAELISIVVALIFLLVFLKINRGMNKSTVMTKEI